MRVKGSGHALNKTMLLLKVHKGHLTRSHVHMAIQNISVPYIILPFRILYYFRSVPFHSVKYTPPAGAEPGWQHHQIGQTFCCMQVLHCP